MYEKQINTIDETSNLVSHALATVARLSESVLVSIVLLIAMIPEVLGVANAQGFAVGFTAGTVSLVTAKIALSDKGTALLGRTLYFGWPMYLFNMGASVYMVMASGEIAHLGYLVISFCGTVSSTRAAEVIKFDAAKRLEDARQWRIVNAVEEEKAQAQIEKLRMRTQLQMEAMQNKHEQKWGVAVIDAPQVADQPKSIENDGSSMQFRQEETAVTVGKLTENRKKAAATVSKRVQERREKLAKMIAENPGKKNSEIARDLSVSPDTIRNDRKALKL